MNPEQATSLALDVVARLMPFFRRCRSSVTQADVISKEDGSPVTVFDLAGQALVVHALEQVSGQHSFPVCGEETADTLSGPSMTEQRNRVIDLVCNEESAISRDSVLNLIDQGSFRPEPGSKSSHWTCDPIDGTKRFISGHHYSTCLGFIQSGELVGGAIGCPSYGESPATGTLCGVVRGSGAFTVDPNDPRSERVLLHVPNALPNSEVIRVARSVGSRPTVSKVDERIRSAGKTPERVEIDNQCKYVAFAQGHVDLITHSATSSDLKCVWDFAPGVLVASEAGGVVTDADGAPLDFDQGPFLSRNRGLRVGCVEAIRACFG